MPNPKPSTAVVVVAAGRGLRALQLTGEAGDALTPKQYRNLAGQPMLARTLRALGQHPGIDRIVVTIHPDDRALYDAAVADAGANVLAPVAGGATRQLSVKAGLEALAIEAQATDVVLIHDAARPFIDAELIDGLIRAAGVHGAIAAVPLADTLKRADSRGLIVDTVDRSNLWRAQTPQAFPFLPILDAHRRAAAAGIDTFTDDAGLAEWAGMPVAVVQGSERNRKLTTDADLAAADRELTLEDYAATADIRTATGFDVHRFIDGDEVMLCGVRVPHDRAVEGHSDADVGLHALTDAVLGTIGADDIGAHFPPSDPQWKGSSSDRFLAHAIGMVRQRGGRIALLDVTLLCESPKIGPFRLAMRQRIAEIAGIPVDRVSVKATTTEQLGFTGRREGLAAMATATVRLPIG